MASRRTSRSALIFSAVSIGGGRATSNTPPPPSWPLLSKLVHLCNKPGEQERCRPTEGEIDYGSCGGSAQGLLLLAVPRAANNSLSRSRARRGSLPVLPLNAAAPSPRVLAWERACISPRRSLRFLDSRYVARFPASPAGGREDPRLEPPAGRSGGRRAGGRGD